MLMNYHEMTMNTSRYDPAKRQQFLVICSVMFAAFAYSVMTSGAMLAIDPVMGVFPGGFFCYKYTNRDYAASMGMGRRILDDLAGDGAHTQAERNKERNNNEAMMYHVYLDDPMRMGGRRQRWMSGIMAGSEGKPKIEQLVALNKHMKTLTKDELETKSAKEVFETLRYEETDLPSVDALVLQFPFTSGFVSALMLSYRVSISFVFCEEYDRTVGGCMAHHFFIFHYFPRRSSPPCANWPSKKDKKGIFLWSFPIAVTSSKCALIMWYVLYCRISSVRMVWNFRQIF
jgi:hypothetical protein